MRKVPFKWTTNSFLTSHKTGRGSIKECWRSSVKPSLDCFGSKFLTLKGSSLNFSLISFKANLDDFNVTWYSLSEIFLLKIVGLYCNSLNLPFPVDITISIP